MRAIVVDDEPMMIKSFMRLSSGIEDLQVLSTFESPEDALEFVKTNTVDIAFLDVEMPTMSGIQLAKELRAVRPDILIVIISAYGEYIKDSNIIGADYYIVKPYKHETLEMMMARMRLLVKRQEKELYMKTFGEFEVLKNGKPTSITGKAKEILAYCVIMQGKEATNEEIYSALWEGREYNNVNMKVYYNAIKRLKDSLSDDNIPDLLVSTKHGQLANTDIFDSDLYEWLKKGNKDISKIPGGFMPKYDWALGVLEKSLAK
ncbi:MAG: response regulator [Spirochaetia bacterium]|nr:response regulator [Spirochaetia bacterium]MBR0317673.1 response regulator [Spirochaetia bacterium]